MRSMVCSPRQCPDRWVRPASRPSLPCWVSLGLLLFMAPVGCDRAPAPAEGNGQKHSTGNVNLVRLPPEEITKSGVTVEPVKRTAFRTYRTFPGVVRPNENALADITTLVRGRVAE